VNFMHHVVTGKDDLAFVAGFSNSIVMAKDFTPDLNELAHGIHELVPVGGTAIWDASRSQPTSSPKGLKKDR